MNCLLRPTWNNKLSNIAFITFTDNGEGIMTYSIESGNFNKVLKESNNDLQSLAIRNDSIFYIALFRVLIMFISLNPTEVIQG